MKRQVEVQPKAELPVMPFRMCSSCHDVATRPQGEDPFHWPVVRETVPIPQRSPRRRTEPSGRVCSRTQLGSSRSLGSISARSKELAASKPKRAVSARTEPDRRSRRTDSVAARTRTRPAARLWAGQLTSETPLEAGQLTRCSRSGVMKQNKAGQTAASAQTRASAERRSARHRRS